MLRKFFVGCVLVGFALASLGAAAPLFQTASCTLKANHRVRNGKHQWSGPVGCRVPNCDVGRCSPTFSFRGTSPDPDQKRNQYAWCRCRDTEPSDPGVLPIRCSLILKSPTDPQSGSVGPYVGQCIHQGQCFAPTPTCDLEETGDPPTPGRDWKVVACVCQ